MDLYHERLIKKKFSYIDMLFVIVFIFLGIAAIFLSVLFLRNHFIFLLPLFIWVVYTLIIKRNKEFEYIVTNNEFDIDQITAQRSRKRLISVDVNNFEVITTFEKISSKYSNVKVLDVSSGVYNENTLIGILNTKQGQIKLIFEPGQDIIESFKKYISRKIIL